jgi:hypothetical protein
MRFRGDWTNLSEIWFAIGLSLVSLVFFISGTFSLIVFVITVIIINTLFLAQAYGLFYWVALEKDYLIIEHGLDSSIEHKYPLKDISEIRVASFPGMGFMIIIYRKGIKKSYGINSLSISEIDRLKKELYKLNILRE